MHRVFTASAVALAAACLALAGSARADYYTCSTGLVGTGTADDLANGSNCAYWLLPSFPSTADGPVRIDLWGDEVDRLTEMMADKVQSGEIELFGRVEREPRLSDKVAELMRERIIERQMAPL